MFRAKSVPGIALLALLASACASSPKPVAQTGMFRSGESKAQRQPAGLLEDIGPEFGLKQYSPGKYKIVCLSDEYRLAFLVDNFYGLASQLILNDKKSSDKREFQADTIPGFWITQERLMIHVVDKEADRDLMMLDTERGQDLKYHGTLAITRGGANPARNSYDVTCNM